MDEEFGLKTRRPLILTAHIAENDIEQFDRLRTAHFQQDRNFLGAHLTMFYRLPGEYETRIRDDLTDVACNAATITAEVSGIRHLGAGVAFSITSTRLQEIREQLKVRFKSLLGPQDMQKWQPHITIQNKAPKARADALYRDLSGTFLPHPVEILGLDLWEYLGGPWLHLANYPLQGVLVQRQRGD
jgi:2'-5' RNA ligase